MVRADIRIPTEPQVRGWPAIQSGRHVLISAPTGSGKTLLLPLLRWMRCSEGARTDLLDKTQVVYVSPLSAEQRYPEKFARTARWDSRIAA